MSNDRETYESLNLAARPIRPHILAASTIVVGEDCNSGRRETLNLSGFGQLNTWPLPGFEHKVEDGCASFQTELISAPEVGIKGYSYELDDLIQVQTNPYLPNSGNVKQITPGRNFPAEFSIRRFAVLDTRTKRLVHRNAINLSGVIDSLPPFTKPLTGPYRGTPRGDGPFEVATAPNVLADTTPPEAWYPANDENQPAGTVPELFSAASAGPCMWMLVDPSLIMQVSLEGQIQLEVAGKAVTVDLAGDHRQAAGAEILLFGPEKHGGGTGVLTQLARVAVTGSCAELGGRVMLRASWPRVSGGRLGEGTEESLSRVTFPSDLSIAAEFELCTPHETLYAANSVRVGGRLKDLEATGTELTMDGGDAALATTDDTVRARLVGAKLAIRDALVGETAPVNI